MYFEERTLKITIDEAKCTGCTSFACVEACKTYARGILTIKDGKPVLAGDEDFGRQRGNECLACEYECHFRGKGALTIEAPIPGLAEYRKKHGVI